MPYADSDGTRIHYEAVGSGPALVLQHGLTSAARAWSIYRYVDALKSDRRVIAIDARGHGESDKPHDADRYGYEKMAADVVAVLDDAGIDRAIFWGYSMGSRIGFAVAKYAPRRFDGFVLGGITPEGLPEERADVAPHFEAMRERGMQGYLDSAEAANGPMPPKVKELQQANDPLALLAVWDSWDPSGGGFADVPAGIGVPCLLYAGEADPRCAGVKAASERIPDGTFFSPPGLNHGQAFMRSDIVLPKVQEFLARFPVRTTS